MGKTQKNHKHFKPNKGRNVAREYFIYGARRAGADDFVGRMLAGMAITIKEYTNMSNDDIEYVIGKTAKVFNDSYINGTNLLKRCYEECDIDVNGTFGGIDNESEDGQV